ncbi:hypothetical protein MATL_G00168050 [Megalops atlanticus]|uniref:Uncharacterized protein n=1 Tax=Megalops atlanticus TaxID=7932 RepID=A0A9D3PQP1_MEGAT|nr:hypothetical protein MATL_G00168050 [Megalops atlanticus]
MLKMFYSKCLVPALALYLLLEEVSAFVLPERVQKKRDAPWLDSELSPHLSELSDLEDALPGDGSDTTREWGARNAQPASFLIPLERLSAQNHSQRRKNKDKRRRVNVPLDSIGASPLLSHRSRKEEPEETWEYYSE